MLIRTLILLLVSNHVFVISTSTEFTLYTLFHPLRSKHRKALFTLKTCILHVLLRISTLDLWFFTLAVQFLLFLFSYYVYCDHYAPKYRNLLSDKPVYDFWVTVLVLYKKTSFSWSEAAAVRQNKAGIFQSYGLFSTKFSLCASTTFFMLSCSSGMMTQSGIFVLEWLWLWEISNWFGSNWSFISVPAEL